MEISIYKNAKDAVGRKGNLFDFFTNDSFKNLSDKVRCETNKDKRNELKKQLPACTASGLFEKRSKDKLIKHSGYICIDIDGQDNPSIDFKTFYKQLGNFEEVAFAGLSVSGKGAFVLIPISNTSKHGEHFKALEEDFLRYGIVIDPLCKDVSRLRFYSYNADPYINKDAVIYTRLFKAKPKRKNNYTYEGDTQTDVETLVNKIFETETDIVPDYNTWFKVGASLANLPNGRELFHIVSEVNPIEYDPDECDKQFNYFQTNKGIGISTFFHHAKINGITL